MKVVCILNLPVCATTGMQSGSKFSTDTLFSMDTLKIKMNIQWQNSYVIDRG